MNKYIMNRFGVFTKVEDWPVLTVDEMVDWLREMDGYGNYQYGQVANMLRLLEAECIALRRQVNELSD